MNLEFVQNWLKNRIIKSPIEFPIRFPIKCPYRIAYEIFHLEIGMRAHLGDSFDEVIGFITTSALPGCADRSVSSSEYRRTEYDEKLS